MIPGHSYSHCIENSLDSKAINARKTEILGEDDIEKKNSAKPLEVME